MSLFYLSLLVSVACAIHAVRSGRTNPWLWVILIFQGLGSLIYLLTQVLPELSQSQARHKAQRSVTKLLDPEAERRKAEAQLGMADTVSNRLSLARAAAARGDFAQAVEQFQGCLKGAYATDSAIMLELAQAQFAGGNPQSCQETLDALKTANPDFRSPEGHLLYARSLEALERVDEALYEYQALLDNQYPGEEARARRALLLVKLGRTPEAQALLGEMQSRFNSAPKFYQKREADWLKTVEQALSQ